ncbi:hypothetical protein [Micromonospora sp. DT31]|uniref:hypothetical protein n=1 Tax=Micromonospora sp. DT31 TaxID=3393434 RepID=UPI003CE96318
MTTSHPMDIDEDRLLLTDPAAARRGAHTSVLMGALVFLILTFFTVGGTILVSVGEVVALPFAIGGALAQLSAATVVGTVLYDRAGSDGVSVSRARLARTSRVLKALGRLLLAALATLGLYSLTRFALGDPWTLVTSGFIGIVLWAFYRGTVRIRRGRP